MENASHVSLLRLSLSDYIKTLPAVFKALYKQKITIDNINLVILARHKKENSEKPILYLFSFDDKKHYSGLFKIKDKDAFKCKISGIYYLITYEDKIQISETCEKFNIDNEV